MCCLCASLHGSPAPQAHSRMLAGSAERSGCLQADKLLSPEFQPVIEGLIANLPPDRQILLYSATFPVTVKEFKDKFLKKPYIINLMQELTLRGITQVPAHLPTMPRLSGDSVHIQRNACCRAMQWYLQEMPRLCFGLLTACVTAQGSGFSCSLGLPGHQHA